MIFITELLQEHQYFIKIDPHTTCLKWTPAVLILMFCYKNNISENTTTEQQLEYEVFYVVFHYDLG